MPKKRGILLNHSRRRRTAINNGNPGNSNQGNMNSANTNTTINTNPPPPRRKLALDPLLSKSTQQLLKGYTSEELVDMFEKVADLENEVGEMLETEPEIDKILGSKIDNQTLWFYVKWGDKDCSFIPAKVLSKIAPEKVIKYYESILTFNPSKKEDIFTLDSLQPIPDDTTTTKTPTTTNRLHTQRENRPRLLPQTQLQPPQPPTQLLQPQPPQPQLTLPPPKKEKNDFNLPPNNNGLKPGPKSYRTMNCTGCIILLQYPEGTKAIKCPACNTVMQAR